MSGIVGIFRRNGLAVERPLLCALTNFISYRGPDAQDVWCDGAVGFGHTMLRTTREAAGERQPANLEGRLWITADVRLDARDELGEKLKQAGCAFGADASDAELVLQAYSVWGERCVEQLRGDFSFGIWDALEKRLFCARDHFGVKPFYYALKDGEFVFSNTLNCVRMHPEVSGELNEAAIGDFLLFGLNCDPATTTFRDIQRLPPAQWMSVSTEGLGVEGLRSEKYWTPPIDGHIRYAGAEEYLEHFREILKDAVGDRLRTDRAGIFLSGGLDSGAIAATAKGLTEGKRRAKELRAYTVEFERLPQYEEGYYARKTAEYLNIPIRYLLADDYKVFDQCNDADATMPEPVDDPLIADILRTYETLGSDCRVVFSGQGGDNLMDFQMWPYAKDLFRRGEWSTLGFEMAHFLWIRPFPWRGLKSRAKRFLKIDETAPVFPEWIQPEFAKRMKLTERWKNPPLMGAYTHPVRPRGHASLALPNWAHMFENGDPGATRRLVEMRYPLLDLRVVEYLLAIPAFPWSYQKRLLRKAMDQRLPEAVLTRKKTPFPVHPFAEALKRPEAEWLKSVEMSEEMESYVARERLSAMGAVKNGEEADMMIRPLCLNFWLQCTHRVRYNFKAEVRNA